MEVMGCNEENMDPLDETILRRIRNCSIIPRSLSDFQVFVRSLTKEEISECIVEEVWKKLFGNEKSDISDLSSSTAHVTYESCKQSLCGSPQSENLTAPQQIKTSSINEREKRLPSMCGVDISRLTKRYCSENEADESVLKSRLGTSEISEANGQKSFDNTSSNSESSITSQSFSQGKIMERETYCNDSSSFKLLKNKSSAENSALESEDGASDCEVIEIVSLNKSNNSNNLCTDTECDISDSEESVIVLPHDSNTKKESNHDTKSYSPNRENTSLSFNSSIMKANGNNVDESEQIHCLNNTKCLNSVDEDKQQKVKRGKNLKYRRLKAEVECLKSLLVNLLVSLQINSKRNEPKNLDPMPCSGVDTIVRNTKKKNMKNQSFLGVKEGQNATAVKRKVIATKKTKSSVVIQHQQNKGESIKATKCYTEEKQKESKELYKSLPETIELESFFDDLDNEKRKKFLWREVIIDTLKTKPSMQLRVEKLKRIVIAKYFYHRGSVSQNTNVKFFKNLHSTEGVVVNEDVAVYSGEQTSRSSYLAEKRKKKKKKKS